MTMYQLVAFIKWMARKSCQMPLRVVQAFGRGLNHVAFAIHKDGALGVLLGFLIACIVGLLGLFIGGVYLEHTKEPGTTIHVNDILIYWVYFASVAAVIIFVNAAWYCFRIEQHELFDRLKDGYDRTT